MAGIAVNEIARIRQTVEPKIDGKLQSPALGHAYVIRQFKRPEEIDLMRDVYGEKFLQVSVYLDNEERESHIVRGIQSFNTSTIDDAVAKKQAIDLVEIDHKENKERYGQRVADVFHLGDVFVSGDGSAQAEETIRQFVRAFFGDNKISPTKIEYGMYAATGASLRSVDLSR